jgi:hypothetical protein
MKLNKSIVLTSVLLIVTAALYRVWPDRPVGFVPQIAMAIFAGATIKDKKWAFALPLFSMLISDALYQVLYVNGFTKIQGFYSGQWINYILLTSLTVFGLLIKKINFTNVLIASLAAPTFYFIISNFTVWAGGGGYQRPKTFDGLIQCYGDAIAFYRTNGWYANEWVGTLLFSGVLFGAYYLLNNYAFGKKQLA